MVDIRSSLFRYNVYRDRLMWSGIHPWNTLVESGKGRNFVSWKLFDGTEFLLSALTAVQSRKKASSMGWFYQKWTAIARIHFLHLIICLSHIDPVWPVGKTFSIHDCIAPMLEIAFIFCDFEVQTTKLESFYRLTIILTQSNNNKTDHFLSHTHTIKSVFYLHGWIEQVHFMEIRHIFPNYIGFRILNDDIWFVSISASRKNHIKDQHSSA